jgi:hypothetical protein
MRSLLEVQHWFWVAGGKGEEQTVGVGKYDQQLLLRLLFRWFAGG